MPREGSLLNGKRWAVIFLLSFFGTASLMTLCRTVLIPIAAPWHIEGLTGQDQIYYHRFAVALAQNINENKWGA